MTLLLYHTRTRPTGRKLANLLGVYGTANPGEFQTQNTGDSDTLIRWGSQAGVGITPTNTLNYRTPLARVSNKYGYLQLAKEASLPVPNVGVTPEEVGYPCLARRDNSSGGRGIQYLATTTQHEPADFYSEYIPVGREFRAHVYNESCIALQEKVLTEGWLPPVSFVPRNHANGYTFRRKSTRYYPVPAALGVAALRIAGLHFGAVDMVTNVQTNMLYVLEVNSAPAIEGTTLTRYALAMAEELDIPGVDMRCQDYMDEYGSEEEEDE